MIGQRTEPRNRGGGGGVWLTDPPVDHGIIGAIDSIGYCVRDDDTLTIAIISPGSHLRFTIHLDPKKIAACRTLLRRTRSS